MTADIVSLADTRAKADERIARLLADFSEGNEAGLYSGFLCIALRRDGSTTRGVASEDGIAPVLGVGACELMKAYFMQMVEDATTEEPLA